MATVPNRLYAVRSPEGVELWIPESEMPGGGGGLGDVFGPSSSVDGNLAVFNGVTGKLLKDGGKSGILTPTAVKTAAYNAVVSDFIPVDTTSGTVTITLPTAPANNTQIAVKQVIRGGTNTVSVITGGSDVFNRSGGGTTATLTLSGAAQTYQYQTAGAIWYVIADDMPYASLLANAQTWAGVQTFVGPILGTPTSVNLANALGLPAAAMPALAGDVTTAAGAVATTLATVNSNVGSFRNASLTANAKGLITTIVTTSGTAFPVSPSAGDQFFRTDLGHDCYYDGIRWLTKHEYLLQVTVRDALEPNAVTYAPIDTSQAGMWLTRFESYTESVTTNNGSNFHTLQLESLNATNVSTGVGSSFNTSADTVGQNTLHSQTLGVAMTAGVKKYRLNQILVTGSPGGWYAQMILFYRLIVT